MKNWAVLVSKHLHRNIESAFWLTFDKIQHLRLSVSMVLDDLIGTIAMIMVDAAVCRQYQLHIESLHLDLGVKEISQRIQAWATGVKANVRCDLRQQMIADD